MTFSDVSTLKYKLNRSGNEFRRSCKAYEICVHIEPPNISLWSMESRTEVVDFQKILAMVFPTKVKASNISKINEFQKKNQIHNSVFTYRAIRLLQKF